MVLDPVGGDYIRQDQSVLNPDGRIVVIALMGGRDSNVDLGFLLGGRD